MDGIFISYRRDDSAGYAGRLYDRLVAHFGADRVFMDVEGIEPGVDFVVAIEEALSSCRVLIAVIGDEWTSAADAAGRRRLDDPNDFIRLETGAALQRGIRVVPVLVGGAVMPLAADLPDELKTLPRRQAIEINHKQWEASTGELIRTLEGILDVPPVEAAARTPPTKNGKSAAEGESASIRASDGGKADGDGKRQLLPLALAALIVAAVGIWVGLGDRETKLVTEKAQVGQAPAVAIAPGPQAAAPAPMPPIAVSEVKDMGEPVVAGKPLAPPAVATAGSTHPEATSASQQPPLIREFKADVAASHVRLCYRVRHAESLALTPRPGELLNVADDCIDVKVDAATTFTLTARNSNKTVRKTLTVAPRPAAVAQPSEAPARMAAPAAAPVPASALNLPVKGERWVYRSSGKWPTSPKRRFEIVAQSVADSLVTEELRVIEPEGGAELRRARGNKPDFIVWNAIGPEFSPYFGAYVALARQDSLSGFPTPDFDPQWTQWYSRAEVIGQESVSVPAGSFNAFKVEVWSSRRRTGSVAQAQIEPVRVHYLIWYAPQIKRYVRMQRSITSADNSEGEKDLFELVAHRSP